MLRYLVTCKRLMRKKALGECRTIILKSGIHTEHHLITIYPREAVKKSLNGLQSTRLCPGCIGGRLNRRMHVQDNALGISAQVV